MVAPCCASSLDYHRQVPLTQVIRFLDNLGPTLLARPIAACYATVGCRKVRIMAHSTPLEYFAYLCLACYSPISTGCWSTEVCLYADDQSHRSPRHVRMMLQRLLADISQEYLVRVRRAGGAQGHIYLLVYHILLRFSFWRPLPRKRRK